MKLWHLDSLAPSTRKRTEREPGADAPRVPLTGRQMPRVLFSAPECRVVVIDLQDGEEMGAHQVRERVVLEVVSGSVTIEVGGTAVQCDAGTLVTLEPEERHAVRALADSRLLLVLAPWPQAGHFKEGEPAHGHVPVNATVDPDQVVEPQRD